MNLRAIDIIVATQCPLGPSLLTPRGHIVESERGSRPLLSIVQPSPGCPAFHPLSILTPVPNLSTPSFLNHTMTNIAACGPSDEGLEDLIQDLSDEPLSLGKRDAWQPFFFSLNPSNSETSRSGRWRRGADSNEVATTRLFGWVHHESMLGPYGSMEHANLRWIRASSPIVNSERLSAHVMFFSSTR